MKIESNGLFGRVTVDTGQDMQWSIGPEDASLLSERPLRTPESPAFRELHSAALAFLNEYEAYRDGEAVTFTPSPEVLEALRKAVKG